MKTLLVALLLGAVALVMARWLPGAAQAPLPGVTGDSMGVAEVAMQNEQEKTATPLPMIDTVAERQRPSRASRVDDPAAGPVPSPQAVSALRESMRHGDPRTPPLAPRTDLREPPSAAELADPALYQQYEQRQQQSVYASFANAVDQRIPELEAMIAKGRASGISEAQLAEGEAKLAKLSEQRDQLSAQQAEPADEASSEQD
ncbi:MAG: hypothetical protein V7688_15275 [Alcanivorax jadensis]|uniref:hypothetical protein n=1 Tax=Alcanivorax jadensis TaxID=64988 RepID=UPI003003A638